MSKIPVFTRLLLYTEVRWLSKSRSLARAFELQEPLQRFLLEKQSPLAAHFSDTEWVAKLAYLCGIFNLLNKLNLSLQGRTATVFKLADKVTAFKAQRELWGPRGLIPLRHEARTHCKQLGTQTSASS